MTEVSMQPITVEAAVAIARIEATLDGVKKQIDHQDRNTGQLVKMFEGRMVTQLEEIKRRLEQMEKARDQARQEAMHERQEVDVRLKELEQKALDRAEKIAIAAKEEAARVEVKLVAEARELDVRVSSIEKWKSQTVGVAMGAGLASGGVVAVIAKAIGGL